MILTRNEQFALRYLLPIEEVDILLPLVDKYNIHIYDVKILYDKYKSIADVKLNIKERTFRHRAELWLQNEFKIYNTDRFRKSVINYLEKGTYTNEIRNKYPKSNYMQFWKEEARRCLYGYLDGDEWVTGYHYFYLNYSQIELTKIIGSSQNLKDGKTVQGERVVDFPVFWDSDYFYYHYLEEAERNGLSASVLKTRGRGYSWKASSMLNRNFYLIPRSRSIVYASDDEYLAGGDGILTKAWNQMSFIDEATPWVKKKQKKDTEHHKRASMIKIVNGTEIEMGFKSEIIGKTLNRSASKAHPYNEIVYTPTGKKLWKDIQVGSKLFTNYGTVTTVTELHEVGTVDVWEIEFNDGRKVKCSEDHNWNVIVVRGKEKKMNTLQLYNRLYNYKSKPNIKIKIPKGIDFPKQNIKYDAYTLGLMLGDGSMNKTTNNLSYITMMRNDIDDIKKYIPYKVEYRNSPTNIRNVIYIDNGREYLKELNLFDKKSHNKFIPDLYKYNTKQIRYDVISGLLDTDGSVTNDYGVIEYSTKSKQMAEDFIWILHSLGIGGKMSYKIINEQKYYRCYVYCNPEEQNLFKMKRKQDRIKLKKHNAWAENKRKYITIKSITKLNYQEKSKCVTVKDNTHRYLISQFIDTQNSRGKRAKLILYEEAGSFNNLIDSWIVSGPSVTQDGVVFGLRVAFGTGGDDIKSFQGLYDLFYKTDTYNIYSIPNIWTPGAYSVKTGWFQPDYASKQGFYDEDGNSEIVLAKEVILQEREKIMKSGADISTILKMKAERPIIPEEALLRTTGSPFPVNALKDQMMFLNQHSDLLGEISKGKLVFLQDNKVRWLESNDVQIIETHNPSKLNREGGIEIYQPPIQAVKETTFGYIIGVDPVDFDYAEVSDHNFSLGSCFVMNTITKRIVAEYTGRPELADTFYENVRRLALYYNATVMYENNIKGLYTYFVNKFSEHLLAFKPKILDDGDTMISVGRRKYGYTANERINKLGLQFIKKWLQEPIDNEGNLTIINTIKSKGLLDEMIEWNPDGNFDRVSAMIALMVCYKDVERMLDSGIDDTNKEDYAKFWNRAFKYR